MRLPGDADIEARAGRPVRHMTGAYPTLDTRWSELGTAAREWAALIARHPLAFARVEARFALELVRIAAGRSCLTPAADDRRFEHAGWRHNPVFHRALQTHLAFSRALFELIESCRVDPERQRRLSFLARHVQAAAAPSNLFLTHPGFYQRARESRGASVIAGLRHVFEDVRERRGMPRQVDPAAYRVGRNIAATAGAVVYRTAVFELIQYGSRSARVDARAVLFCPPQINKYYIVDLAPDESFVRYALAAGQQMFAISWRNPTAAQRDWGLARYVASVCQAIDIVRQITGDEPVKLVGACAGGLTATAALARLAALGEQHKVACLSLLVTLLEPPRRDDAARARDSAAIDAALARSAARGVLDGADTARASAWLRPDDRIWYFVTHNYVLGHEPPADALLYWANDTTRVPARLHADLLTLYRDNKLRQAGALELDGVPIDIGAIDRDVFVVAGAHDHVVPWQSCFRSMKMFKSNIRFVLGAAGHMQTVISPPGGDSARFYTNDDYTLTPAAWRRAAREQAESWWPAWIRWCERHGGGVRHAPAAYGSVDFEPIEAAPGRYVRQR